jgi:hypothetical protein
MKKLLIAAVLTSAFSLQPSAVAQSAAVRATANGTLTEPTTLWSANSGNISTALSLGTLATQNGTFGNATQLTSGTVPAARLPNITLNMSGTLHNTPITFTNGVGNATLANQTANRFLAGPSSGNATTPTFRALTSSDLPDGGLGAAVYGGSGKFVQIQTDDKGRVSFASEGNLGTLASQNGTYGNATELTTGTLSAARLPNITLNLSGVLHTTPVTITAGVGNATLANQTANTIFAGPSSGNATTPTFRALTLADLPAGIIRTTGNNTLTGNWTMNGTAATTAAIAMPETSSNSDSMIYWGAVAAGNNISFRGSSQELILSSRDKVAIVPDQSFQGGGFIQLGNNGGTSEKIFISQEGPALATVINSRSHRFGFKSSWWNGSSSVDRDSVMQSTTDSTGNGVFEFFPNGSLSAGSYNGTTNKYDYAVGNRTLGILTTGLRTIRSATSAPAYSFDTNTTTGLGCDTGGDWFLSRNGTYTMGSNPTYGVIVNTNITVQNGLGLKAGSAGFNSWHRTDDTTTGAFFPAASTIAIATGGTERIRFASGGVTIGANGTAMALIRHGSATLTSGTVTVSDSTVTTSARIFVTRSNINASTGIGSLGTGTITASTSFVVNSRKADATIETGDASTVQYMIVEP